MRNLDVELVLTQDCNFRCKYCYEKDSRTLKSVDKTVVDAFPVFVKDLQKHYNSEEVLITWFGGEPTLKSDIIIDLTTQLMELPYTRFLLVTNGYDISKIKPLILRFGNQPRKFHLQISYDNSPVQEKNRIEAVTKHGLRTKEHVLDSIYWAAEHKVSFTTKNTISIHDLKYFDKVFFDYIILRKDLNEKFGTEMLPMKVTLDTDCPILSNEELQSVLNDFHKCMMNILEYQLKSGDNSCNWLMQDKALCSVKQSIVTVDVDGNLYPCHGAIFSKCKDQHFHHMTIFNYDVNVLFRDIIYGTQLSPDHACNTCPACTCSKCNIHCFEKSNKPSYDDKMEDFGVNSTYCAIQKEISKFAFAKVRYVQQYQQQQNNMHNR